MLPGPQHVVSGGVIIIMVILFSDISSITFTMELFAAIDFQIYFKNLKNKDSLSKQNCIMTKVKYNHCKS